MTRKLAAALAGAALATSGSGLARPPAPAEAATPALPSRIQVMASMERVADWQLTHMDDLTYMPAARPSTKRARDWQQATFWVALTHLADRSSSVRYRDAIFAKGTEEGWRLGDRLYHADDHIIGAAWIWAARKGAGAQAIAPMRADFDRILAAPKTNALKFIAPTTGDPECTTRWCWCDALFMAPPTLWGLSKETKDKRYAAFADREYRATTAYLFDKSEHLYFRDSRFFDQRGSHGEKLFWSRGNGWVFSGLARMIPEIPAGDPRRAYYIRLFKEMAAKLVTLQRGNGYWPPSLLADPERSQDESSGTGFYVHGMAWGIKAGLLDRKTYLPAVTKGWVALERAVQPNGMLGWVQQVSDRPDVVKAEDAQFYGTGAYLLAGAAVYDLTR
ncbi:glycoside hydrolase family 88 protein [Sphingomonas sp. HITSZ_GF]|uniref:glycoside hydrolase family 88/105 protein n=1 Tax=Sphingomonas sp. HITSZ_GF TaxID=3037247 RepID=UPI00240E2EFC|nr:glycoside hydrolase family 88 protein [Sphingomonas sp. HITSZ_GF]MDG2535494.1 glycoside hydrolase family 88 protein [Sphingomonas sp. HITSZ_GF]